MLKCRPVSGIAVAMIVALPSGVLVPTDGWAQIEEIVVTTRRREENLQEVPISVTAIDAQTIERQNINNMFDIAKLDPSLQMDVGFTPSDTRITIRGLVNTRGRSNVAMLVDGVDVTTENQISAGSGMLANTRLLNDLERIEVVKGPQSALFGRAAFAGAISYTTKEPGDEFSSKVGVEVGDYGIFQATGSVGGPVAETFGLLANGVYWSHDGFYDNSISGADVGGGEGYGLALTGVYEPAESFKLKFRVAYSDDEFDQRPQIKSAGDSQEDVLVYPIETLTFGNAAGGAIGGLGTGLRDFDLFCPQGPFERGGVPQPLGSPYNPTTDTSLLSASGPGICVPQNFGDANGKQVTLSENPLTGNDYPGSTMELLRGSLTMNWDLCADGGCGTLTSVTGYTDADTSDYQDQDFQSRGRPDPMLTIWETHTQVNTEQFSQELRWASNFDGPVQFTAGALYWDESRAADDQNYIIGCSPFARNLTVNNFFQPVGTEDIVAVANICDGGTDGGFGFPANPPVYGAGQAVVGPILPAQTYFGQLAPIPVQKWMAETEHWSLYGMLEWDITDRWKLTLEDRYVDETFDISRPNQSGCSNVQFALGRLSFAPMRVENLNGTPGDGTYFNALCTSVNFDEPSDNDPNSPTFNNYAIISGTEKSSFHTPKVTVEWMPADEAMLYFSWAHAQKPGGITTTSGGNAAATIEDQRFLPEEMDAWEIGTKTNWQAAGNLRLNAAVFFQDYTDKQVGTQVLVETPPGSNAFVSQARVVNAAAAEVLGVEFEALWLPSFLDGLSFSFAYTWLDPEYTDFVDETVSAVRAAAVGECPVVYTGGQGPNPGDKTDPANGSPACALDLSGHQLENTPENSFVTQLRLQRPLFSTGIDWFIEGNTLWQDKRFESADNWTYWEDFWLTDIRFGFQADKWDFLVYVDNVFDDDTIKAGGSQPDFGEQVSQLGFTGGFGTSMWYGTLPDPRVWGIRANYRFGN